MPLRDPEPGWLVYYQGSDLPEGYEYIGEITAIHRDGLQEEMLLTVEFPAADGLRHAQDILAGRATRAYEYNITYLMLDSTPPGQHEDVTFRSISVWSALRRFNRWQLEEHGRPERLNRVIDCQNRSIR